MSNILRPLLFVPRPSFIPTFRPSVACQEGIEASRSVDEGAMRLVLGSGCRTSVISNSSFVQVANEAGTARFKFKDVRS